MSSHTLLSMWLLIHTGIKVSKRGPRGLICYLLPDLLKWTPKHTWNGRIKVRRDITYIVLIVTRNNVDKKTIHIDVVFHSPYCRSADGITVDYTIVTREYEAWYLTR